MKIRSFSVSFNQKSTSGSILIGLTIGLIGLVSVLFTVVSAYKKGTDREMCISAMTSIQKATHGYANLHQLHPGDPAPSLMTILMSEGYHSNLEGCPAQGTYTYNSTIPSGEQAVVTCSISTHVVDRIIE